MTELTRNPRIIELRLVIDAVHPKDAVLPKEQTGPTSILIYPVEQVSLADGEFVRSLHFRIAFEPENCERRRQPLRHHSRPTEDIFPHGWKYGDPYEPPDEAFDIGNME